MKNLPSVTINAVDNGWIVTAGCLTIAFTDANELGIEIMKFLAQPEKTVEEYNKRYRRAGIDGGFEERIDSVPSATMGVDKQWPTAVPPSPYLPGGYGKR